MYYLYNKKNQLHVLHSAVKKIKRLVKYTSILYYNIIYGFIINNYLHNNITFFYDITWFNIWIIVPDCRYKINKLNVLVISFILWYGSIWLIVFSFIIWIIYIIFIKIIVYLVYTNCFQIAQYYFFLIKINIRAYNCFLRLYFVKW